MNDQKPSCLMERFLKSIGFKLIHDGQNNPGQFQVPPEEIRCFTRKYRLQENDEWKDSWVVFKYDNRSHFVDFEFYSKEPNLQGREKMTMKHTEHLELEEAKKELLP